MLIITSSLIQNVADPYFSVRYVIDMANRKIQNEGMTVIQKKYCEEILRGVINSYGLVSNFLRKTYTLNSVANQQAYIIDRPNVNNIINVKYNDQQSNFEFLTEERFQNYEPYYDDVTFFTLKNNGDYFNQLLLNPIPTEDGLPIVISYYSAGNEPIAYNDSFINFPNEFIFNLIDSLIYKYIELLPPDDKFKNEQNFYFQKDVQAKKQFAAWMNSLKFSNGVMPIKYDYIPNQRATY